MTRSNVVITRQPSPPMKLPYQVQQPCSPLLQQHTSSASFSQSTASDLHSIPDNFIQHSPLPSHTHEPQLHPLVKEEQILPPQIPNSVKGAPPHLRPAIRKRQNSESAKRSRQRRKEAAKVFYRRFDEQCQRLSVLEQKVATLVQLVKESDEEPSEIRAKPEHDLIDKARSGQEPEQQTRRMEQASSDDSQGGSIVQSMAAMTTSYEEEEQDNHSSPEMTFEDDLEALLDSCVHSQELFGSC